MSLGRTVEGSGCRAPVRLAPATSKRARLPCLLGVSRLSVWVGVALTGSGPAAQAGWDSASAGRLAAAGDASAAQLRGAGEQKGI